MVDWFWPGAALLWLYLAVGTPPLVDCLALFTVRFFVCDDTLAFYGEFIIPIIC